MEAIYQIEKRHQNYAGHKKVTAILNNENGKNQEIPEYTFSFDFRINIKRVRRIMRKHGIKADVRQKKRSRKKEQQQYQADDFFCIHVRAMIPSPIGQHISFMVM